MIPNLVSKMFHKCQRALHSPNSCRFTASNDGSLARKVDKWKVQFEFFLKEPHNILDGKKFENFPMMMRKQWEDLNLAVLLKECLMWHKIPTMLKEKSATTMRLWAQQCECVIAQRIRRGQQIFTLYTKLWEERALKEMVRHLSRRGRDVLLATCVASVFNWEQERITDDIMRRHMDDIEYIYKLQDSTMTCPKCGLRLIIDHVLSTVQYCHCAKNTATREQPAHLAEWEESVNTTGPGKDWVPFIERQDVLVWRQEHHQHSGLYAYKVYGRYNDVTARDFLQVQLDTQYRREWDATAVQLEVLDSEPNSGSEVLYWEMAWPRLFANRDYVFKRRSLIDDKRRRIVIRSESTQHPSCPPRSGLHRVNEYWSFMVIKPLTELNQPGIEFSLTYFDNPGLSIPSAVAAWVAISGLPDFLNRLRDAARILQEKRATVCEESIPPTPPPSNSSTPNSSPEPSSSPSNPVPSSNSGFIHPVLFGLWPFSY